MIGIPGRSLPRLETEATQAISRFILNCWNPQGGFRGRDRQSDLYYTVFGLACARALNTPLSREGCEAYLESFADGAGLDFVHLTCLARCWGLGNDRCLPEPRRRALLARLEGYRGADGGYHREPNQASGLVYESFLAVQALLGLKAELSRPEDLCRSLVGLRSRDGAFANRPGLPQGTTTVTAAAISLWSHFGHEVPKSLGDWLLARTHPLGGFVAHPQVAQPDLLSTATALHALALLRQLDRVPRAACLDFVQDLWHESGGFCGHAADPVADCEYTFYGLLALDYLLD